MTWPLVGWWFAPGHISLKQGTRTGKLWVNFDFDQPVSFSHTVKFPPMSTQTIGHRMIPFQSLICKYKLAPPVWVEIFIMNPVICTIFSQSIWTDNSCSRYTNSNACILCNKPGPKKFSGLGRLRGAYFHSTNTHTHNQSERANTFESQMPSTFFSFVSKSFLPLYIYNQ